MAADPLVIGLGHYARVGKDTVADILVRDHGFEKVAFADALRAVAYETSPEVRQLVDLYGWDEAKIAYPKEVRHFLVDLGNAVRNILGCHIWVEAVFQCFEPGARYVISDCRYPNEVQRVLGGGGEVWKILRPGIEPRRDVADQALVDWDGWTRVLDNDGTKDDLAAKVACLVQDL